MKSLYVAEDPVKVGAALVAIGTIDEYGLDCAMFNEITTPPTQLER